MKRILALVCLIAIGACSSDPEIERRGAIEHGRDLFSSTTTSASKLNAFSCATCHLATPDTSSKRILPGYPLAGATARPWFWGGERTELLRAVNDCRYYFMGDPTPWRGDDVQAAAMYAYLASLPPAAPGALSFTVPRVAEDLSRGDATRGQAVYDAACRSCHGAAHTGEGRLRTGIVGLPEESVDVFRKTFGFGDREVRVAFVEKVRHGPFLGLSGTMPLFSTEALGDEDLAAVLTYLGLYR